MGVIVNPFWQVLDNIVKEDISLTEVFLDRREGGGLMWIGVIKFIVRYLIFKIYFQKKLGPIYALEYLKIYLEREMFSGERIRHHTG